MAPDRVDEGLHSRDGPLRRKHLVIELHERIKEVQDQRGIKEEVRPPQKPHPNVKYILPMVVS